ncbi:MAG: phosphomannomutase/phosphoglucomutase [Clostridiales bacterium]|nr:phosphomannomutase/phosphoglucomutase [Clostridiales bacterium]
MALELKKLQNGSDIRGVSLDGVPGEPITLGKEEARALTRGFILWLQDKTGKLPTEMRISVGHDSRISADALTEALIYTMMEAGVRVFDCGLASTPAMFMSTMFEGYKCDGAIMITASHLPSNRNGFKYFSEAGGLDKKDIARIIELGESGAQLPSSLPGSVDERDLIGDYSSYLRNKIIAEVADEENPEQPLKGLKIVVDAGNGAGGFYATRILEPLGADITGSQFLEPDGNFPNHQPNPENKAAMASISGAVIDNNADLGLIFDTDVDRSAAVDRDGREISRNGIVALAAALIAVEHPGTTVVTDSITSDQLTTYLEECLGLKHLRFKRGYRNVINKSIELNEAGIDSQLAIETSGHAAYKENYFLDDGAYLATKIVIKEAQLHKKSVDIGVLISSLEEPKEAIEVRLPIDAKDFGVYGDQVLAGLEVWVKSKEDKGLKMVEPNYEGIRINFDLPEVKGWCLLRKSLHDPIMPLNVEVTEGSCETILEIMAAFLDGYTRIGNI